jgi:hypothetical protein
MKTPILTDSEIEACVRMKYKCKTIAIAIINQEAQELKEMRNEKYRLKFNDMPLITEK